MSRRGDRIREVLSLSTSSLSLSYLLAHAAPVPGAKPHESHSPASCSLKAILCIIMLGAREQERERLLQHARLGRREGRRGEERRMRSGVQSIPILVLPPRLDLLRLLQPPSEHSASAVSAAAAAALLLS